MLAFCCVSHQGELEIKTAFLIYTLKKQLKDDFRLYVCIPESNQYLSGPSDLSLKFYNDFNTKLCTFRNPLLERRHELIKGDLISNKIYALSVNFAEDRIVFLDSDIAALNNFDFNSFFPRNHDLIIKPANRANINSWEKIYKMFGQSMPESYITTEIDKKRTPPYFNAGVIGIKNEIKNTFWLIWAKYFEHLWDESIIRKLAIPPFHRDQIALSLAINEMKIKYSLIPEEYNFPFRGKKFNRENLPKLVHYHRPYAIFSSGILKEEFKEFIKVRPEFNKLILKYSNWKNLSGSNFLIARATRLRETLRYKKYIIKRRVGKK
jgi:hypothetical protein